MEPFLGAFAGGSPPALAATLAAVGAQQGPQEDRAAPLPIVPVAVVRVLIPGVRPHNARRRRERPVISRRNTSDPKGAGFDRFDLRSELQQAIADAAFTSPRPIQAQAMPPALAGRDVLGLAQTGTGKTAAFVLPILQRLLAGRRPGPRALVVAPTRELATQVHTEFERLATHTPLGSIAIFGGVPIPRQVRALRQGPDVVVACPGRLLDLLGRGALRLDKVEVLVLDEADHMFDMGFLPDVRRILKALPARRQNLLFSATMPRELRGLADGVLNHPAVVELGNSMPAETIEHALLPLAEGDKVDVLERLLAGEEFRSAIVFLRTKRRAKQLALRLDKRGHRAIALQGNMSQGQRDRALGGFREGRYDVLVATDIAARGLDIAGVSHVVNFDVPGTPDAYTHRIGRTGRSELSGVALTFVTPADAALVRAIEKRLGAPIERRRAQGAGTGEALARAKVKGRRSGNSAGARTGRSVPRPVLVRPAAPAVAVQPVEQVQRAAFGLGVAAAARSSQGTRRQGRARRRPRGRRRGA